MMKAGLHQSNEEWNFEVYPIKIYTDHITSLLVHNFQYCIYFAYVYLDSENIVFIYNTEKFMCNISGDFRPVERRSGGWFR